MNGRHEMKKKPAVRVRLHVGTCTLFCSWGPMRCPLCQVVVPASTSHTCANPKIQERP